MGQPHGHMKSQTSTRESLGAVYSERLTGCGGAGCWCWRETVAGALPVETEKKSHNDGANGARNNGDQWRRGEEVDRGHGYCGALDEAVDGGMPITPLRG